MSEYAGIEESPEGEDDYMNGAGPFSMMAIAALENHIHTVRWGNRPYAAVRIDSESSGGLTPAMIFCRGLLGYNKRQELELRSGMRPEKVCDGDWIVMVSRTEYVILRVMLNGESLFSLMPTVPVSSAEARLACIAQAHKKDVDQNGGTHGVCVECYQNWDEKSGGCPTYVWATRGRDILSTWDPADDDEEGVVDGS